MASPILTLALSLVSILFTYRYLVHPLLISPLSKVPPAHWSAPISPLWILHTRRRGNENATVHALHQRLGPLVRLGPSELSVNCVDGGVRTVYGGGFDKGAWYAVFDNYGRANMFSARRRADHGARKRMLSGAYAKSAVQASAALHGIAEALLCGRVLPRLYHNTDGPVEAYELFSGAAMDAVTAYCFGLAQGSDFASDPARCRAWVADYRARQEYLFWPQEMPRLTALAGLLGVRRWLIPRWVDAANAGMADWVLGLCDAAEAVYGGRDGADARDRATVYNQLRGQLRKSRGRGADDESPLTQDERLEIASELMDQVLAGFDTTGITLTYLAWQLSRPENGAVQRALREELRANGIVWAAGCCPDLRALDALPLLHAVVAETLRLHAAIPGCQPRMTPAGGVALGPAAEEWSIKGLPAGVRVNSYAYTLHRNADVFPRPERWDPSRWLDGGGAGGERARWFWAFGSGGRMCIGSHLAVAEIKCVVAAVWGAFETAVVDDAGMVPKGGYTCEPLGSPEGNYLLLSFTPVGADEVVAS